MLKIVVNATDGGVLLIEVGANALAEAGLAYALGTANEPVHAPAFNLFGFYQGTCEATQLEVDAVHAGGLEEIKVVLFLALLAILEPCAQILGKFRLKVGRRDCQLGEGAGQTFHSAK